MGPRGAVSDICTVSYSYIIISVIYDDESVKKGVAMIELQHAPATRSGVIQSNSKCELFKCFQPIVLSLQYVIRLSRRSYALANQSKILE